MSIGSLDGMADRTVTISGLGKAYAVTGWRIGWAVAAAPLTALIRKVHDYLTVCAPAPFQAAGIVALGLPESYYADIRAQYAARRAILLAALDAAGMPYRKPEGAYYVMADFAGIAWDQGAFSRKPADKPDDPGWTADRAFAEYMAREIGVAVVPGSSFYASAELVPRNRSTSRVRLNFAKREDTLREAARRLQRLRVRQGAGSSTSVPPQPSSLPTFLL